MKVLAFGGLMTYGNPLTREQFLYLAKQGGLDVTSPHMDELYAYVQTVLASLESLRDIDVTGAEPAVAFMPHILLYPSVASLPQGR